MAESYLKFRGCTLELEASQFALVFAALNDCMSRESAKWVAFPHLTELSQVIRAKNLDHDYYCVFDLDPYLLQKSDIAAFLELIADSITFIRNAGWENGISTSFYASFKNSGFAPPFVEGTNWRAVAWPLIQIAAILLLHNESKDSWPLLKVLGW